MAKDSDAQIGHAVTAVADSGECRVDQQQLLTRYRRTISARFPELLENVLTATAEHGVYGQDLLAALHDRIPRTDCGHCGRCCNSISMYSLEYHRIIRDFMQRLPPERIKLLILRAFRFDLRLAEIGTESRIRCTFRDDEQKICLIHPVRPFPCRLFGQPIRGQEQDCAQVRLLVPGEEMDPATADSLQIKIFEASEHIEVIAGKPAMPCLPFEYWLLRAALGGNLALRIYQDLLVPLSTPLTNFWTANSHPPQA